MENPQPNFVLNTNNNPQKFKNTYQQKTSIAFLCSLCFYISIFYIFNLSPSKLFSNSRLIWFFLSNTLIIIILVDYGAFSSSSDLEKLQKDIFLQNTMRRYHYKNYPSRRQNHFHGIRTSSIPENDIAEFHDHNKEINPLNENRENLEKVPKSDDNINANVAAISYRRRKSGVVKRVVFDESKNIVRRVQIIADESSWNDDRDEQSNNKYATLSNEELNRRVEDFIQRFNKQIRLQRDV